VLKLKNNSGSKRLISYFFKKTPCRNGWWVNETLILHIVVFPIAVLRGQCQGHQIFRFTASDVTSHWPKSDVKGRWRERVGANCHLLDMDGGLLENTVVNLLVPEL